PHSAGDARPAVVAQAGARLAVSPLRRLLSDRERRGSAGREPVPRRRCAGPAPKRRAPLELSGFRNRPAEFPAPLLGRPWGKISDWVRRLPTSTNLRHGE